MTNQQQAYERLRKKCYSIIYPDWLSLGFGCEIKFVDDENWNEIIEDMIKIEPQQVWNDVYMIWTVKDYSIFVDDVVENLGPDLSLQDILRALEKNHVSYGDNGISFSYEYSKLNKKRRWVFAAQFILYPFLWVEIDIDKKPKDRDPEIHLQLLELLDG